MTVKTLLDTLRQQAGQMLITRHAVCSLDTVQILKPVQITAEYAFQPSVSLFCMVNKDIF
ncbi:hypothetical protein BN133_163 [Cronobacter dublinensis 582]|nr:hypothetical protein BN133_163 [Cronobacter dublinensis 582]